MTLHEVLAREMVRAVRGKRSQAAFNRRFGFKTNVVSTWERGTRQPTAAQFFEVAERLGLDVRGRVRVFLHEPSARSSADTPLQDVVLDLFEQLRGTSTVVSIAARMGKHRVAVGRWLKGQTEPRLPELLALVDVLSPRLLDFVAVFCDPAKLPSAARAWADLVAQRSIAFDEPWSHALLRALELDAYAQLPKHEAGVLGRAVGLSEAEEKRLLEQLGACRQVTRKDGRWINSRVMAVDTGGRSKEAERLKQHWANVALARLRDGRLGDGLFSYNLFVVSNEDYEQIRQLHLRYFNELRAIVQNSTKNDRVVLVNQQLVPLAAP
jgi:transcriptional regulator with XRE-family HTH domain